MIGVGRLMLPSGWVVVRTSSVIEPLKLSVLAGAAEVLDVDVLDVGAHGGEAPGDMGVAAGEDEGQSWQGEAGDVERVVRRVEFGFVPDVRDIEVEVHVVGQQRRA
jgi:hypothetical protein